MPDRRCAPAVGRFPCPNPLPGTLQERVPALLADFCSLPGLLWVRLDHQQSRLTMDKHLLGDPGLPASFALPSVAACRRALAVIRPRLIQLQAADATRRQPRLAFRTR